MKSIMNWLLPVTISFCPMVASAQGDPISRMNEYMAAQVNVRGFSGVVLVSVPGKPVYRKAFGPADREWKIANTPEGKFEIGSLTKQFTAAAILLLAEQHKLRLDDKLDTFFPGFPKGDSVTLHMLLNHTSGIVDYTGLPRFASLRTLPLSKDSVIGMFRNQPYLFPPGTRWSYSNSGYFLLGCIIEKVSKQSYADFIKQNILSRAGLEGTLMNQTDSVIAIRTRGYSRSPKGVWKNAEYISMEFPFSAGALLSTVDDLLQWQRALWTGKVISLESVSKMTTPYLSHYGYGLIIDTFLNNKRISHSGEIPGFSSGMCYFPGKDLFIAVLSNDEGEATQIAAALSSIQFGAPVRMPHTATEAAINSNVLDKYIGKYRIDQESGTLRFELLVIDKKLYLKPAGAGNFKMQLKPESETLFFLDRDPEQEFEFTLDRAGKVQKIYFTNRGIPFEVKRD